MTPDPVVPEIPVTHQPVRFYGECSCAYPPEEEPLPDEDPRYFTAEYEDAYLETHMTIADGDFMSCELAFDGHGCDVCSEERGDMVDWPCAFGDPAAPLPEAFVGTLTDRGDHFEVA